MKPTEFKGTGFIGLNAILRWSGYAIELSDSKWIALPLAVISTTAAHRVISLIGKDDRDK